MRRAGIGVISGSNSKDTALLMLPTCETDMRWDVRVPALLLAEERPLGMAFKSAVVSASSSVSWEETALAFRLYCKVSLDGDSSRDFLLLESVLSK